MARATTILVVDDERSVRDGTTALLSLAADFEVIGAASNGQEAIQIVSALHPDVILMDVRMPVMDGLDATREISRSVRMRYRMRSAMVIILRPCLRENRVSCGRRAIVPSRFMISQITAAGRNPPSLHRSTDASV